MKKRRRLFFLPLALLAVLMGVFFGYAGSYYHAGPEAEAAMRSDDAVAVRRMERGWLFQGPGTEDALIFYPGGKVEETAYAPLLRRLSEDGLDVYLVKMPFRLAFFAPNSAERAAAELDSPHLYLGGHSLGGAMAANYAAGHEDALSGLVLLAAYPTKPITQLPVLTVCGSEDGVLDWEKLAEGRELLPADAAEAVMPGGNHAQFGDYGEQKGDGEAALSADEQRAQTVTLILDWLPCAKSS